MRAEIRYNALVMNATLGLREFLFGKSRGAILSLLYRHPEQSRYYRQITRSLAALSRGTIQRELETLTRVGLITRQEQSGEIHYQANASHAAFCEIRDVLAKTADAFELLGTALEPLSDAISCAFVYGSAALQGPQSGGDIDLMVVGSCTLEAVLAQLSIIERSLGHPVKLTIYTRRECRAKFWAGLPSLQSAMRSEKRFVIGDERDLSYVHYPLRIGL